MSKIIITLATTPGMTRQEEFEAAVRQRDEQREERRLAYAERYRLAGRNDHSARLEAAFHGLNDAQRLRTEARA